MHLYSCVILVYDQNPFVVFFFLSYIYFFEFGNPSEVKSSNLYKIATMRDKSVDTFP